MGIGLDSSDMDPAWKVIKKLEFTKFSKQSVDKFNGPFEFILAVINKPEKSSEVSDA